MEIYHQTLECKIGIILSIWERGPNLIPLEGTDKLSENWQNIHSIITKGILVQENSIKGELHVGLFPCTKFSLLHPDFLFQFALTSLKGNIMVSKVEEAMKRNKQMQPQGQNQQQQLPKQIQCNKGKTGKFKRSSSNLEEDGASSAILFLACIACAPSYA
ncbi:unnamed protein product [Sphenostylis stenocarpa]|uniref:Uncharacterized protein n=1 Tax=Sphenostylis stenocarpa TaxID=92480 RepID=A0AA86VE43_9FABA|nr:unnamed protein product [Sphenostylis stenocarpa]